MNIQTFKTKEDALEKVRYLNKLEKDGSKITVESYFKSFSGKNGMFILCLETLWCDLYYRTNEQFL